DARLHEALGLGHDVVCGPAHEIAAKRRNDAERAAVVTTFRDLEIGVVTWREAQALRRDEIKKGIVQRRYRFVHGFHHGLVLVRTGDGEQTRMGSADHILLDPET